MLLPTRIRALPIVIGLLVAGAPPGWAQGVTGAPGGSAPGGTALRLEAAPLEAQTAPDPNVRLGDAAPFEHDDNLQAVPTVLLHQFTTTNQVAPDSIVSLPYLATRDDTVRRLTLKEAVYLALRNNPNVRAASLDPIAATESVRMANGIFDPDLVAALGVAKSVVPVTSALDALNAVDLSTTTYQWNFGVNKLLAPSNGQLSLLFANARLNTNNFFESINPQYTPALTVSLAQPLLRNFGWLYATINVRLAESAQKQGQYNYAQQLDDFVQKVAGDYWAVVFGAENLEVAREALKFNNDLVRQNRIAVRVGTLAPIDLLEAEAAAATSQANVYSAEASLRDARAALRQDVMLNPAATFIPQDVEPAERPRPDEPVTDEEERALEDAFSYLPSLAAQRQAIRTSLLEVRYMENQLLPNVSFGAQYSSTSLAGQALCLPRVQFTAAAPSNCVVPPAFGGKGFRLLPFAGGYATALNQMFGFHYYSYTFALTVEMPLDNAPVETTLALYRVNYEQLRVQYRAAVKQAIINVKAALANLAAGVEAAKAAREATDYAREALREEQVRFKVGTATTHDLLQFENQLTTAEGNQVQAEVNLENAKIALRHDDGTLLRSFNVRFQVQNPVERPWYALF